MNYSETINYLECHCHEVVTPGLARMRLMADLLGNPHLAVPVVHVAGTNGKGSTTAMLAAILRQSGYEVGIYTSPHLVSYTERIQKNFVQISEAEFARQVGIVIDKAIPAVLGQGLGHPTEFEVLTMAAFCYFARQGLDILVVEVGLGGRMDSTNMISPLLSVITPISLDHCQILGNTLVAITGEKAGIIKAQRPVVVADQDQAALAVLAEVAWVKASPLTVARPKGYQSLGQVGHGQRFSLITEHNHYDQVTIGFFGDYQTQNACTAIYAAEALQDLGWQAIDEETILAGLAKAVWPGRMEYFTLAQGRGVLFDGAHNQAGIGALARSLAMDFSGRPLTLVLGILDDKDQMTMTQALVPLAQAVLITKPAQKRAVHWQDLAAIVQEVNPGLPVAIFDDYRQAMDQALANLQPGGLLCVTGSLYLLGDCRQYFKGKIGLD